MKVECWMIGKTTENYIKEGVEHYQKRIQRYLPFEMKIFPASKAKGANAQMEAEKDRINKALKPNDELIILDENGSVYTSQAFAAFLQKWFNESTQRLIFLVGGAYGIHENLQNQAKAKLALSHMTFPHELVRVVLLEQLYRGLTIINNEPYHH